MLLHSGKSAENHRWKKHAFACRLMGRNLAGLMTPARPSPASYRVAAAFNAGSPGLLGAWLWYDGDPPCSGGGAPSSGCCCRSPGLVVLCWALARSDPLAPGPGQVLTDTQLFLPVRPWRPLAVGPDRRAAAASSLGADRADSASSPTRRRSERCPSASSTCFRARESLRREVGRDGPFRR